MMNPGTELEPERIIWLETWCAVPLPLASLPKKGNSHIHKQLEGVQSHCFEFVSLFR